MGKNFREILRFFVLKFVIVCDRSRRAERKEGQSRPIEKKTHFKLFVDLSQRKFINFELPFFCLIITSSYIESFVQWIITHFLKFQKSGSDKPSNEFSQREKKRERLERFEKTKLELCERANFELNSLLLLFQIVQLGYVKQYYAL